MKNLIRRRDFFSPDFLRDFFEDDFLTDSLFHRKLNPPVNISEDKSKYSVEISTPGIDKKNIKIQRQNNILTFSYEQKDSREYDDRNYHRKEFQCRSFSRSLSLPDDVDMGKITSEYKDGILTISIPKLKHKIVDDDTVEIDIQ